jgi:hypothetical protein
MTEFVYPDPVPLEGDGIDYEVLAEAARSIIDVPGLTMDIGLRTGGSTKVIVDNIRPGRTHIAIDPYGELPYWFDGDQLCPLRFTNEDYRNPSLPKIYDHCFEAGVNFMFYNMTSEQFMKRFEDGVPVYGGGVECIFNQYALVYFDGCHKFETVFMETLFFAVRAAPGAAFVYDDCEVYDHAAVERFLFDLGWVKVADTERKMSYRSPA